MSEKIIGDWLKKQPKSFRKDIIISTKVCGGSNDVTWLRKNGGGTRINRDQVFEAVDNSLKRLNTDYIDLLLFHWPDRYVPMYGVYDYDTSLERTDGVHVREQLEIMKELMKTGKIRSYGLSNESPYGIGIFTATADSIGMARPSVVQNVYNLLDRSDWERGMIEACSPINGNVGLIPYSPLAGGALSGKYIDYEKASMNSRLKKYVGFMHRYVIPQCTKAVQDYKAIADKASVQLSALALSWVYTRPYVSSTCIGVSNLEQLEENFFSLNLVDMMRSEAIMKELEELNNKHADVTKGTYAVIDPNSKKFDPAKLPWGAKSQDIDPELDALIEQKMKGPEDEDD